MFGNLQSARGGGLRAQTYLLRWGVWPRHCRLLTVSARSFWCLQVEAQGVADLVRQPQPRFEVIKRHYPQVCTDWWKWHRRVAEGGL